MDVETIINCFLVVFEDYKTNDVKVFTIGKLRNDIVPFIEFLERNIQENEWHISFNGLNFDAQIIQFILVNKRRLLEMNPEDAAFEIYKKAQDCISRSSRRDFQEWQEKDLKIRQIDVMRLNHWDNPAKMSSLKWIQFSMDWHNVQDMPIPHNQPITTIEQLKDISKYCRNDVSSCKKIMELSGQQINLRGVLSSTYGINLYSASEPRISKELFLYFLSKQTKIPKYDLKKMRTYRSRIEVKHILLPYIKFNDIVAFQELYQAYENLVINPGNMKAAFKHNIHYKGVSTDFGLGGLHGAKPGIHVPPPGFTIMTSDVTSFYPNLAIRNKWAPAHLPKTAFCNLYEWFFEERKKIPKKDPKNYVYKIILNSTYGLSNDSYSFLYDPEFTMRITINGQLLLMMLYTMLAESIEEAIPIMQNTDGLEMMIPEKDKEKYMAICKQWEEMTQLQLEHDEYQKMIVPDVNNYIAIHKYKEVSKEDYDKYQKESPDNLFKEQGGKFYYAATKCKGRFEYKDLALHKNKSFLIIPKALFQFFVHDVTPEKTIMQNRNIFDYCGGVKIKGNWQFVENRVVNREVQEEVLQKTLRYYVSQKGYKVVKKNKGDGRKIQIESGPWLQTVYNIHQEKPWKDYGIDERYYLDKIYDEIMKLVPEQFKTQTSLF